VVGSTAAAGDLDAFLERSGAGTRSTEGPLVLIVDDDDKLREFVRVNLEMEGYTVREAASAREGLDALEEQSPDLVLLDVMMPEMDGWEMLRQLHERHGMGAIPVIVFSGQVEEDAGEVVARGAQAFIGKPFSPQSLIERTKALLPS
jgi:CheY-like chemotaxis protein